MRRVLLMGLATLIALTAIIATIIWSTENRYATHTLEPTEIDTRSKAQLIEQGAYIAQLGNCTGCHSVSGGQHFAGGKPIKTPFGTLRAGNLTPDSESGLGSWSSDDFYRSMRFGITKSGRLLYPAFPYGSYSAITRQDSNALFAYFQSLPAIKVARVSHELYPPYSWQISLAVWRWLYFNPHDVKSDEQPAVVAPATLARGAYLVNHLGHCGECHSPRNALGGFSGQRLSGAAILGQTWYAPSLIDVNEAGVDQSLALRSLTQSVLSTGTHTNAATIGPMAGVVYTSMQYWSAADIDATQSYLTTLQNKPSDIAVSKIDPDKLARGLAVYEKFCVVCHGADGKGEPGIVPLASNRALRMNNVNNLVNIILQGGYSPATAGNPQPFGMPPFAQVLTDEQIGDVVSYIRYSWANQASSINELQVRAFR